MALIGIRIEFTCGDCIIILEGMMTDGQHKLILAGWRDLLVVLNTDNPFVNCTGDKIGSRIAEVIAWLEVGIGGETPRELRIRSYDNNIILQWTPVRDAYMITIIRTETIKHHLWGPDIQNKHREHILGIYMKLLYKSNLQYEGCDVCWKARSDSVKHPLE